MNTTENTIQNDDLQQIAQLQKRAIEFAEAGMSEEALEAAMVCIGLQEEVAPHDMFLRARLIQNASRILLYTGDLEQAEAIAAEGVELLKSVPECTGDDYAHALLNLSSIQYTKHDFEAAYLSLTEALTIWKQEKGEESAEVADCLSNLGRLREEQGNLDEAIAYHQLAIEVKEKVFGDHEQTAFSQMNKGLAHIMAEQFIEAKMMLEAALACCKRIGKEDSEIAKACSQNLKICNGQMQ